MQPQGMPKNKGSILQQFNEFRKHYGENYKGTPEEEVKNLLMSGVMNQAQFNKLSSLAKYMQGLVK